MLLLLSQWYSFSMSINAKITICWQNAYHHEQAEHQLQLNWPAASEFNCWQMQSVIPNEPIQQSGNSQGYLCSGLVSFQHKLFNHFSNGWSTFRIYSSNKTCKQWKLCWKLNKLVVFTPSLINSYILAKTLKTTPSVPKRKSFYFVLNQIILSLTKFI